jgi:hypothetical protein
MIEMYTFFIVIGLLVLGFVLWHDYIYQPRQKNKKQSQKTNRPLH